MTRDKRTLAVPEETTVPSTDQFDVVVDEELDEPEVRDHADDDPETTIGEATREELDTRFSEYEEVRESGDPAERLDALERIVEQLAVIATGETVEQLKD